MSRPRIIGTLRLLFFSGSRSSLKPTVTRLAFGTSMPTALLPGTGARIRIIWPPILMAMFFSRFMTLETRTPGASVYS